MGFSLARAAAERGASVTLVTGPVHLETPRHVRRVNVETAREMHEAVGKDAPAADVVVMAAAVADYAPSKPANAKIKKDKGIPEPISLTETVDILKSLGERKKKGSILVGFALETENELANAREKLLAKNADMIVLNSLKDEGAGFGSDTNVVTILTRDGSEERLARMPKIDVAHAILDRVRAMR
jgi:phosphopantothenoylcysteine decarboxylase/phosphopantothenate--cysteine ligase